VQQLKLELKEGNELLQTVQTCADSVLPTLSPSGRSHIQSDLETLETSLAGLKSQLDTALTANKRCHSLWCQFDAEHDAFAAWIASHSDELQAEPLKRTSVEDKKTALDIQQVEFRFSFYHTSACNACRARYCYRKSVRPFVCPSVKCQYCA